MDHENSVFGHFLSSVIDAEFYLIKFEASYFNIYPEELDLLEKENADKHKASFRI